ncbi:MAG: hypothetical protein ACLTMR_06970 [Faecalibacillus sp.]
MPEYVEDRVRRFIFAALEGGVQLVISFMANGKVVKKSRLNDVTDGQEEYDVSIPRQRDVMAILTKIWWLLEVV